MALWAQGFQTTKRNKRIKHLLGPCRFTRQFLLQLKSPKGWPHNSRLPDDEKINSDGMYSVIFTQFFMENFFKSGMDFFFEGRAGEPFLGPFIVGSPRVLFDGFWFWPFFHHHPLGFVLSFMASSVGHSSVLFIITRHHAFMIEAPWWKKKINI